MTEDPRAAANRRRCTKHGDAGTGKKTLEYNSWIHMRTRCNCPSNSRYPLYGGRGIRVCARWDKYENFLADMGRKPTAKHSLDRIDVNGNYEPGNCRWATQLTQMNNVRRNILIEWRGQKKSARRWALDLGYSEDLIRVRYHRAENAHQLSSARLHPPDRAQPR